MYYDRAMKDCWNQAGEQFPVLLLARLQADRRGIGPLPLQANHAAGPGRGRRARGNHLTSPRPVSVELHRHGIRAKRPAA